MVLFSKQDLIRDPPFSQLDLISCRNLLIYLGAELHKRVLTLFHYALRPTGKLILGTSEGIGDLDGLFSDLDRKYRVFERLPVPEVPDQARCACFSFALRRRSKRALGRVSVVNRSGPVSTEFGCGSSPSWPSCRSGLPQPR